MRTLGILLFLVALLGLSGCRKEGTAPEVTALDRTTHEPKLPIATGNHATADCNACHGLFDTFTQFTCTSSGCHEQAKTDPSHAGMADYAYQDAKCLLCHPKGEANFDHTKFPIGAGTSHPDKTCANCHKTGDRKQFECTACHEHDQPAMDGAHGSLAGYGWDSAKCYGCHPDGRIPPFDHTKFPIGAGTTHTDNSCANCHKTADRRQFECTACHEHDQPTMDGAHGSLAGYGWESAKCYACHPDGKVPPFDHTWFPIGTGQVHVERTCSTCHPTTDRKQFTCTTSGCHDQAPTGTSHTGVAGYAYESAKCLQCHPNSTISFPEHVKYFPIAAGDDHGTVSCSECHTVAGDRTKTTCNVCHSHTAAGVTPKHSLVRDFSTETAFCLRCHADSQVDRVAAHLPFRITAGTKHSTTGCLKCHPAMRADKPYGADFSVAKLDCLSCHRRVEMDDKHQGFAGYQYQSQSCIQGGCHADGSKPGD